MCDGTASEADQSPDRRDKRESEKKKEKMNQMTHNFSTHNVIIYTFENGNAIDNHQLRE